MNFEETLKRAEREEITKEEAVYLLKETVSYDKVLKLFEVAGGVRDNEVGTTFKLDGFIAPITVCRTNPPCKYCQRSSKFLERSMEFDTVLSPDETALGAKLVMEAGIRRAELGGGTPWGGDGGEVIEAIKAVKSTSNLDIWINVGPALTKEVLTELKKLGVKEVCSSLETINETVFSEVKPGDDINARKNLARMIDEAGLGLVSVMMVGLGGNEDYANYMLWLKQFENLSYFIITCFAPVPGTPMENYAPASPLEAAKVAAVARLILRDVDINIGGSAGDVRLLPLAIMAGANRAMHVGVSVRPKQREYPKLSYGYALTPRFKTIGNLVIMNFLPVSMKFIKEAGMEIEPTIAGNCSV